MKVDGVAYRGVWVDAQDGMSVHIIDQTRLPWALDILRLTECQQVAHAIRSMQVRGAPLIGAVAAYGLCLALRVDASPDAMERDALAATEIALRSPAVGAVWASLDRIDGRAFRRQGAVSWCCHAKPARRPPPNAASRRPCEAR